MFASLEGQLWDWPLSVTSCRRSRRARALGVLPGVLHICRPQAPGKEGPWPMALRPPHMPRGNRAAEILSHSKPARKLMLPADSSTHLGAGGLCTNPSFWRGEPGPCCRILAVRTWGAGESRKMALTIERRWCLLFFRCSSRHRPPPTAHLWHQPLLIYHRL